MTKRFKNSFLSLSLIYFLVGLVMVIWPRTSRLVICYIVGAAALVYGVYRLVTYFGKNNSDQTLQFGLIAGLLSAIAGLMFIFRPNIMILVYSILAGTAVICDSVLKIQLAFELKRMKSGAWIPALIIGTVMCVAGILAIFDPFFGVNAMTIYVGIVLMVNAIANLWVFFEAKRTMKANGVEA